MSAWLLNLGGTAPTIQKSGSDTLTGTDAGFVVSGIPDTESGSLVESQTVTVLVSSSDSVSGVDTQTSSSTRTSSDTASGVDAQTPTASLTGSDTTSGVDAGTSSRSVTGADTSTPPVNVLPESNSTFETGIGGWVLPGPAGFSPTQSSNFAYTDTYSMRVTKGASTSNALSAGFAAVPGQPWTFSAWVYSPATTTASFGISWHATAGTNAISQNLVSKILFKGWQQITVTAYAPATTNYVRVYLPSPATGNQYYIDNVFLGQGSIPERDTEDVRSNTAQDETGSLVEDQLVTVEIVDDEPVFGDDTEELATFEFKFDSDDGFLLDSQVPGFPLWDDTINTELVQVSVSQADTISGVDEESVQDIVFHLDSTDDGLFTDSENVHSDTQSQDLVAASETQALTANPSTYETGQGTESSSISVALSGSDSGSITESQSAQEIFRPVSGADSAVFSESEFVVEVSRAIFQSDSGTTTEQHSLNTTDYAYLFQNENITSGENQSTVVTQTRPDLWTGVENQTAQITSQTSDTASIQETNAVSVQLAQSESGTLTDGQNLGVQGQNVESGSLVDGWSVSSGITQSDSGVVSEGQLVTVLVSESDSGSIVDVGVVRARPGLRPCVDTRQVIESFISTLPKTSISTRRELVSVSSSRERIVVSSNRVGYTVNNEVGCER